MRQSERYVRHREAAHLIGEPDGEGALRFAHTTLLRPDGTPTYQLASAVDDLDFEITHVIRGSDHRANAELQAELIRALGAEPPEYVHHGLLLGEDGHKLSKRHGASSLADLRDGGFPAEAVRAYLDELGLPRHDVHLDLARLRRLSTEALAALTDDELAARVGVPVSAVPVLRGARDLAEAREYAALVLEPPQLRVDAPETLVARPGAGAGRDRAARARPRAEGRGRRPEGAAPGAHRPRPWAGAVGGRRRAPSRRARAPDRGATTLAACASTARSAADSRSCRRRPARSGCTSAARPSTSAPTSVTRARSCSACGCAAWLRERGYEATLVHNITDVNDKIYDAAPGASAELAARATEWYLQDTADLGLGMPDALPKATEAVPEIVRFIEELIDRGIAYAADGDVYFRVASDPGYGRLSGQRPDQMSPRGAEPAQGGSARLRALEGDEAGRGHVLGRAVGARPPGLAHRVLGDGGGGVRAGVRDPRRRARPRLPAPRERARPVARARPRLRAHLDAQRHARVRRREDVEVARQRRLAPQRARHVGPRGRAALLHDRPLAQADRLHRRDARAGALAGGDVPQLLPRPARREAASSRGRARATCSTTTSTRPTRSRSSTTGARAATGRRCATGSRSSGSGRSPSRASRRASCCCSRSAPGRPRAARTSPTPTACATRSSTPAGRCATSRHRPASGSCPAS